MYTQNQIHKALMVYRSLNGLVPEYLSPKFNKRNILCFSFRDSENKLVVPFPGTHYLRNIHIKRDKKTGPRFAFSVNVNLTLSCNN